MELSPKKKLSEKELAKRERLRKRQEEDAAVAAEPDDPLAANYGEIPFNELKSKASRKRTEVKDLNDELREKTVLIRGHVHASRGVGKKLLFLIVRQSGYLVQCVWTMAQGVVSQPMMRFARSLARESIIVVEGVVSMPIQSIIGATQQVEIQMRKVYCIKKAPSILSINVEDAARSEVEIEKALQAGEQLVHVNQDMRLKYRVLDLRTPANQGIFRIEDEIEEIFRQFLRSKGFVGTRSPKLMAGSSEGGSAVFKLDYKGRPACLAQSPQLHKQMSICGDFGLCNWHSLRGRELLYSQTFV